MNNTFTFATVLISLVVNVSICKNFYGEKEIYLEEKKTYAHRKNEAKKRAETDRTNGQTEGSKVVSGVPVINDNVHIKETYCACTKIRRSDFSFTDPKSVLSI
ncbi:hypothetical protein TNCV_1377511 [Trichonephila clavipes]|nr:hypothetical protein TNCV_1377511 [Trichonephila clavipes]